MSWSRLVFQKNDSTPQSSRQERMDKAFSGLVCNERTLKKPDTLRAVDVKPSIKRKITIKILINNISLDKPELE